LAGSSVLQTDKANVEQLLHDQDVLSDRKTQFKGWHLQIEAPKLRCRCRFLYL